MSNTAAAAPSAVDTDRPRRAPIALQRDLATLVRREFWEHRALWVVPLVVCVLLLISAALTQIGSGGYSRMPFGPFNWDPRRLPPNLADAHTVGIALYGLRQWMIGIPLYIAATIVIFFYLLSALYDERKDRSILFWKSLPVSDGATVASKLLVALVILPLGTFAVALVTNLLYTLIWSLRTSLGWVGGPHFIWDTLAWLKVEGLMLAILVLWVLWYAPMAAYLVLISAWARRSVFLWALLPPIILAVVERVAFGTSHLGNMFIMRLSGIWTALGANYTTSAAFNGAQLNTYFGRVVYLPAVFDSMHWAELFADARLWLGVVVAAVFTYAAVRLRRLRDDT